MIVLDASAVINMLTDRSGGEEVAEAIADHQVHAPAIIDFEVMSALSRLVRTSELSLADADEAYFDFSVLPIQTWPLVLHGRVLELRQNFSPFDATYVALAEAIGCPVLTSDERWVRAPGHRADVRIIGGE